MNPQPVGSVTEERESRDIYVGLPTQEPPKVSCWGPPAPPAVISSTVP
jgi:hypothetical protein